MPASPSARPLRQTMWHHRATTALAHPSPEYPLPTVQPAIGHLQDNAKGADFASTSRAVDTGPPHCTSQLARAQPRALVDRRHRRPGAFSPEGCVSAQRDCALACRTMKHAVIVYLCLGWVSFYAVHMRRGVVILSMSRYLAGHALEAFRSVLQETSSWQTATIVHFTSLERVGPLAHRSAFRAQVLPRLP